MAIKTCGGSLLNYNSVHQCRETIGAINGLAFTHNSNPLTLATSAVLSNWITEINKDRADRMFILRNIDDAEVKMADPIYKEGNLTPRVFISNGDTDLNFHFYNRSLEIFNDLQAYQNITAYAYLFSENGGIIGYNDGTNFKPIPVYITVSAAKPPATKNDPWMCTISLRFAQKINNMTWVIDPSVQTSPWSISDIEGIQDVKLTQISCSSTVLVVDVTGYHDNSQVVGLVAGDFQIQSTAGVSRTISTVTYVNNRYTVTGTGFTSTDLAKTKDQPNATTKGIETRDALALVVT